jgi:hypothetical protein
MMGENRVRTAAPCFNNPTLTSQPHREGVRCANNDSSAIKEWGTHKTALLIKLTVNLRSLNSVRLFRYAP